MEFTRRATFYFDNLSMLVVLSQFSEAWPLWWTIYSFDSVTAIPGNVMESTWYKTPYLESRLLCDIKESHLNVCLDLFILLLLHYQFSKSHPFVVTLPINRPASVHLDLLLLPFISLGFLDSLALPTCSWFRLETISCFDYCLGHTSWTFFLRNFS